MTLGTQSATATAGADRRWKVVLAAQPASAKPLALTAKGVNTVEVPDVLLGDVWLCSGQSNMTMPLANYPKDPDIQRDIAAADFPLIRQFGVEKMFAPEPLDNVKGEWLACDKKTALRFSAVAFYFARRVHAETGVPIGILRSAAGGTVIECWLSDKTFFGTPALEPLAGKLKAPWAAWQAEKQAAIQAGKTPDSPDFPRGEKIRPARGDAAQRDDRAAGPVRCAAWSGTRARATPSTFPCAKLYAEEQRALIGDWRRYFNDESLPFLFVQLPNYRPVNDSPAAAELWSFLRESQRQCLRHPPHRHGRGD